MLTCVSVKKLLAFCVFLSTTATVDATISCSGKVGYLGLDPNGAVVVANGTAIHTICSSTTQGSFQINPQACKMFYATLVATRLADRAITVYYNDPSLTSCTQIGSWTNQFNAYFLEQTN